MVERRPEEPRVGSSNLPLGTINASVSGIGIAAVRKIVASALLVRVQRGAPK